MAEGARLESVFRGNSNQGSNPCLSAISFSVNMDNQSKFIADTVAGAKQYGIQGVIYFDAPGDGENLTAPDSTLQNL